MRKFTDFDILSIRSKRAAGQSQPSLALEYRCSVNTIRSIEKGLSYREVGGFVATDDSGAASETAFLARLEQEGIPPAPCVPDAFAEMLASAEPLAVSLARSRAAEAAEHSERMEGLKALKTSPEPASVSGSVEPPASGR